MSLALTYESPFRNLINGLREARAELAQLSEQMPEEIRYWRSPSEEELARQEAAAARQKQAAKRDGPAKAAAAKDAASRAGFVMAQTGDSSRQGDETIAESLMRREQEARARLDAKRREQEEAELGELREHPEINALSKKLAERRRQYKDGQTIHKREEEARAQREAKLDRMRREMEARREAEVTDGPRINEISKRMAGDGKRGPSSMLDWEKKRQARLERRKKEQAAKEAAQVTARPAMSKGSQRLVEKKREEQKKKLAREKIFQEAARIAAVAGIDPKQLAALGIGPNSAEVALPQEPQTPGRGLGAGSRRGGRRRVGAGGGGRSSSVPRPPRAGADGRGGGGSGLRSSMGGAGLEQSAGDRLYGLAKAQQERAAERREQEERAARARAVPRTTGRRSRGAGASGGSALLPAGAGIVGGRGQRERPSWSREQASGGRLHRLAAERAEKGEARRARAEAAQSVGKDGRPLFQPKLNARSRRIGAPRVDDGQGGGTQSRSRLGSESEDTVGGSFDGRGGRRGGGERGGSAHGSRRGSTGGVGHVRGDSGSGRGDYDDGNSADDGVSGASFQQGQVLGAAQLLAQARAAARRRRGEGQEEEGSGGGRESLGGLGAALAEAEGFLGSAHSPHPVGGGGDRIDTRHEGGHAGRPSVERGGEDNELAAKGRQLAHRLRFGGFAGGFAEGRDASGGAAGAGGSSVRRELPTEARAPDAQPARVPVAQRRPQEAEGHRGGAGYAQGTAEGLRGGAGYAQGMAEGGAELLEARRRALADARRRGMEARARAQERGLQGAEGYARGGQGGGASLAGDSTSGGREARGYAEGGGGGGADDDAWMEEQGAAFLARYKSFKAGEGR